MGVAPLAGAWIEIININIQYIVILVAPLAGAWIEILNASTIFSIITSLLSQERGLKSDILHFLNGR